MKILVSRFDPAFEEKYVQVFERLKNAGFNVELYPTARKLGRQIDYADNNDFDYILIADAEDVQKNIWQVNDLNTGDVWNYPDFELIEQMKQKNPPGCDSGTLTVI
jgi:histidyl-tRNA synthetase